MSSYGRYRSGQGAGSFRSRSGVTTRRNYTPIKKMQGNRYVKKFSPKFATVGYNRDVEKKYVDRGLIGIVDEQRTGPFSTTVHQSGWMWMSKSTNAYDFSSPSGSGGGTLSNNLLRGVDQGTTATSRIGNVIRGRSLKGAITLNSAKIIGPSSGATSADMNGEAVATNANATHIWQYLRTTWRVVIVKDLQVNSSDLSIQWSDVFETNNTVNATMGEFGGIHSELKIANMGRFRIISDTLHKTDAKEPQKTFKYAVSASTLGNIRYNGPTNNALTDKGIYVIYAAYTGEAPITSTYNVPEAQWSDGIVVPTLTMHSRLCFTDL
nr:MAG: replication associated protein [ssDNA virus sp.]